MKVLADIATGETDWADVLFLIAVIVFVIATVIAVMVRTFYAALISVGLACASLAWLLL